MTHLAVRAAVAIAACLAVAPSQAEAYPEYRRLFRARYGVSASCQLCHADADGSERNPYGREWGERGETLSSFAEIEPLDSDSDGIANADEIRGGSNPGDRRSIPGRPGKSWTRTADAPIPESQLVLVLGAVDRLAAIERDLEPAEIATIEAGAGELAPYDRYPTLYIGSIGGARESVALFSHFEHGGQVFSLLTGIGADGKVKKVAMFRAGDDTGSTYSDYLHCLAGHHKDDLPDPGDAGCPRDTRHERVQRDISASVRRALWTASVLSRGPDDRASAAATPTAARSREAPGRPAPDEAPAPPHPTPRAHDPSAPLDFSAVPATARMDVHSDHGMTGLVLLAILAFVSCVVGSAGLARRRLGSAATPRLLLRDLPGSFQLLVALVVVSLLAVQAVAGADAYVQVSRNFDSTADYFRQLSFARMLGISHSHMFGYVVMYGLLAALACMTQLRETVKCVLIAAILWAGLFDVVSWWAIRCLSGRFEWLSITTAIASVGASLVIAGLVARELLAGRRPVGEPK